MVLYTSLWNPSNYNNSNDDDDEEEDHHDEETNRQERQQQQQQQQQLPRTIEYGSINMNSNIFDRQPSSPTSHCGADQDDNDKTVTWDDDNFSKNDGTFHSNDDNGNGGNASFAGGGGGSTGTSSSQEQALPSLTAAFQNLENRSIIINCLWYLLIYMTIAVIMYSFVLEKWSIIDSLYFAVATL
jgi:hypothetical protein